MQQLLSFFESAKNPVIVVSTLLEKDREAVVEFLLKLNAPVYLEGVSGIREDQRLEPLRIANIHNLWEIARGCGYVIDGILRIGGVPTLRPWRDLEEKQCEIKVCSVSHLPFSGLSWSSVVQVQLTEFFQSLQLEKCYQTEDFQEWMDFDRYCTQCLQELFHKEPLAEPSFFHFLSQQIPKKSLLYLGNSLPIREWDLAAEYVDQGFQVFASRGLNGIDGQISTFLGLCQPGQSNWGIFGDLTALYDLAGPWILEQLSELRVNLVIMNNGGGKIFSRMFQNSKFQNQHTIHFQPIADLWGISYHQWKEIPQVHPGSENRLIECIPDLEATERFWNQYTKILVKEKKIVVCT